MIMHGINNFICLSVHYTADDVHGNKTYFIKLLLSYSFDIFGQDYNLVRKCKIISQFKLLPVLALKLNAIYFPRIQRRC